MTFLFCCLAFALGNILGSWSEEYDWVHGYKDFDSVYGRKK